jgi:D-arabinose 1-dehydrogenase-like Zn-dependent alcohol dehydrogenase
MSSKSAQAIVFESSGRSFSLKSYEVLKPLDGSALVSMERSGICGTDIHIAEGRLPLPQGEWIVGHELVGRIAELGKGVAVDGLGSKLSTGDAVIACVAIPCGTCASCQRGETASCMNFGVTYMRDPKDAPHFFGGFGEVLHSPFVNLVKVPEGIDFDAVSAFPCGGPTVIRAFTYAGGLEKGELVVVQGTGSLGLFAIAYAVAAGCKVVAIGSGSNPKRNELAKALGVSEVLDFRKMDKAARLARIQAIAKEMKRGNGADLVIETSGAPDAVPEAMDLLRTRGRYVVPGQYSNSGAVSIQPQLITFKALRITGSGQYTLKDIATYLDFIKGNPAIAKVFASCVAKYKLSDWQAAFKDAKAGLNVKTAFSK